MFSFRTTIHRRPSSALAGPQVEVNGHLAPTLAVAPNELAETLFDRSFEQVTESLQRLERMFIEPDGSFVWTSAQEGYTWQVDGNLYDRQERLSHVDVSGKCPETDFDRLLTALGWPAIPVVFQLAQEAIVLEEAEFRRCASDH